MIIVINHWVQITWHHWLTTLGICNLRQRYLEVSSPIRHSMGDSPWAIPFYTLGAYVLRPADLGEAVPQKWRNNYIFFLIGRRERNIMPTLRRASLNLINILVWLLMERTKENLIYPILFKNRRFITHYYLIIPYHTIPYHTIPYHTIPYHTIPYHTILYYTILYYTILYYI
jgi:hypothetical protein